MALIKYAVGGEYSSVCQLVKQLKDIGDSRTIEDLFDSLNSAIAVFAPEAKALSSSWKVRQDSVHRLTPCVALAASDEVYAYRIPCKSKFPIYGFHGNEDGQWWFSTVIYDGNNNYAMYEYSIHENFEKVGCENIGSLIDSIKKKVGVE